MEAVFSCFNARLNHHPLVQTKVDMLNKKSISSVRLMIRVKSPLFAGPTVPETANIKTLPASNISDQKLT